MNKYLHFNNEKYRKKCLDYLPLIKNIIIPPIVETSDYETVFIEFRWLPHMEYLIRNTIIKLPTWKHTIVCGNKNIYQIRQMCKTISNKINIIHLNINTFSVMKYSSLLLTTNFWKRLSGKKILLYQEDTFLFHGNIKPFLKYDFIGAPWPKDFKLEVGNGGFSLRTRDKMIEIIENYKITEELQKNEDVFFCTHMLNSRCGLIAPKNIAQYFAEEFVISNNPLGGHKFYFDEYSLIPSYTCLYMNKLLNNKIINYGVTHNIINQCPERIELNYNLISQVSSGYSWIGIIDQPIQWTSKIIYRLIDCQFIINISNYTLPDKISSISKVYITKNPNTPYELRLFYNFILRKINKL